MDLRTRFANETDEEFCFTHAVQRASNGEQIYPEIAEKDNFFEGPRCLDCENEARLEQKLKGKARG